MRIRPYIESKDFEVICQWITDERTHAMWCANLLEYPIAKENLNDLLEHIATKFGDSPFVATTDTGEVIGFFCYSSNLETNEGMLKFVMVDNKYRGKGYGKEMITLAVKYAFEIAHVNSVQLNVFPENARAMKCYTNSGFHIRKTDDNAFQYKDELWGRCNMVINRVI